MYEQTNTMMETKTSFQIPQLLDGDDFTSEDLADDMEGLRLSFTRIKIPGGGHLQFEIPSGNPDVPDYAPYLEGVILYSHNSNAYWPEGSEYDDDQPPLCQSFDGKVGYADGFVAQIKDINAQRAQAGAAASSIIGDGDASHLELPDNGAHFALGAVIDGEREELPA